MLHVCNASGLLLGAQSPYIVSRTTKRFDRDAIQIGENQTPSRVVIYRIHSKCSDTTKERYSKISFLDRKVLTKPKLRKNCQFTAGLDTKKYKHKFAKRCCSPSSHAGRQIIRRKSRMHSCKYYQYCQRTQRSRSNVKQRAKPASR